MACANQYTFSGSGTSGLNGLTFTKDQYGGMLLDHTICSEHPETLFIGE